MRYRHSGCGVERLAVDLRLMLCDDFRIFADQPLAADGEASEAPSPALPKIPRLRDFMTPLEQGVARVSPPMEPERLAPLLVRLDEFYDDAVLQLARAHHLASLPLAEARLLAPEFLERLYKDFARASMEDHILAEHEKDREAGKGTGLRELLPELVDALENA